jgi:hypothetical protein
LNQQMFTCQADNRVTPLDNRSHLATNTPTISPVYSIHC